MIALTSLFLLYLLKFKPNEAKFDQILNIFNTLCLLVLLSISAGFWILESKGELSQRNCLGLAFIRISLVLIFLNALTTVLIFLFRCLLVCSQKKN